MLKTKMISEPNFAEISITKTRHTVLTLSKVWKCLQKCVNVRFWNGFEIFKLLEIVGKSFVISRVICCAKNQQLKRAGFKYELIEKSKAFIYTKVASNLHFSCNFSNQISNIYQEKYHKVSKFFFDAKFEKNEGNI